MRTVIFDLDGTLADTSGDLIAAANMCFQDLSQGAPLEATRDMAVAFRGGRAMLRLGCERLGLNLETVEQLFPPFLQHYGENIDVHTKLYPGVVPAVENLLQDGYRVGICTNKPGGLAEFLMQRLGVRDLFASLIGADTLPVRKPDPAPFIAAVEGAGGAVESSLLVGDTVTDRETARAAGVPSILVEFGPEGGAVANMAPEGLLDHYDNLGAVVRRLIG